MKMVSAAKLKKAQDAITAMRPYANKLTELLQNFSGSLDGETGSKFADKREVKNVLVVAITSNRGLCGAFNSNVIKQCLTKAEIADDGCKVDFLTIGKKGCDQLGKSYDIVEDHSTIYDELRFDRAAQIAEQLMKLYMDGSYDKIEVVYNRFKNAATQIVTTEQFLPILPAEQSSDTTSTADYIFEPTKLEIVEQLIPKSLKTQLFKAVRDSYASEHGARMTAMHKATDNATELRDQLKLTYNQARQAAITNEILEIVGGAEALNN